MNCKLINRYRSLPIQLRASIWFLVCSFMQKGVSSITTPIFTRLMTTDEYGQFSVFNSWLSIITVFVSLNLYSGVYTQGLVKFDSERDRFSSSLQGLTLILVAAWTIIYIAFHSFFNKLLSLTTVQMLAMMVIIWMGAVYQFWAVEQRVALRYKRMVLITALATILRPALCVVLVLRSKDKVTARILGMATMDLIIYIGLFFSQMCRGKVFFSKRIWLYVLKFNLPLIPHYLSMSVLGSSDRIMIQNMVGSGEAGIYNLAYSISLIMTMFNTALLQTIEPWLFRKIKDKRIGDIAGVAYPAFLLIACINLLLIVLAPEVITIFAPKAYHEAVWVIPPVAMSVFFMFAYSFFSAFEFYYEKTNYVMLATSLSAALNIGLNYIFIRRYGYIAAAYTTLVCYICYTAFHYVFMSSICKRFINGEKPYNLRILIGISCVFMLAGFGFMATYRHDVLRYALIIVAAITMLIKRHAFVGTIQRMLDLKKMSQNNK